jgi:UDPglucose 6-dehydrogenase
MKITILGTGYVGLVCGVCLADMGNDVYCTDIDKSKIELLNKGISPIYEHGLEEILKRNLLEKRIKFTTNTDMAIKDSEIIYIAVGTPSRSDGTVDLRQVFSAAENIANNLNSYKIIINKSTVPVGTSKLLKEIINEKLNNKNDVYDFDIVSNPEFLKEGAAIEDFMKPDRIILGSDSDKAISIMKEIYKYFVRNGHRIFIMDTESAEMTKYAANTMLATKISFINEIANICEKLGANIENVCKGIGADTRIGYKFLNPGPGFGGSCFPKDLRALINMASDKGTHPTLLQAVNEVNEYQKQIIVKKILAYYGEDLRNKVFSVWGLSFKPKTNDMREAPSISIINSLIARGAKIMAFDPESEIEARKIFENLDISYYKNAYDVLKNSNALIIITEWGIFRNPNFNLIKEKLLEPVIFDGRNLYDIENMVNMGFEYFSIGRKVQSPI